MPSRQHLVIYYLPFPFDIIAVLLTTLVGTTLIVDASRMSKLLRPGLQANEEPLLDLPGNTRRQRWGYALLFIFWLAPLMLQRAFGVQRAMPAPDLTLLMAAIAASVAALWWAERRQYRALSMTAALFVVLLPLVPYAAAGPQGWFKYYLIVSLLPLIAAFVALAWWASRTVLGHRPRSRALTVARICLDLLLCLGLILATYFLPLPTYG